MSMKAGRTREALLDLAELVAKAFFGGLGVAIAMAVAILALSPASQAADTTPPEAQTGAVFHDPGSDLVEAVYVFTLPERAAVDHVWL